MNHNFPNGSSSISLRYRGNDVIHGDVEITKDNITHWKHTLRNIRHITGSLSISTDVTLNRFIQVDGSLKIIGRAKAVMADLVYVGGNCLIDNTSILESNKLRYIGGNLRVDGPAKLENLKFVRGNLDINWGLEAYSLTVIGGNLFLEHEYKLRIDHHQSFMIGGNLYIDFKYWRFRDAIRERMIFVKEEVVCTEDDIMIDDDIEDAEPTDDLEDEDL